MVDPREFAEHRIRGAATHLDNAELDESRSAVAGAMALLPFGWADAGAAELAVEALDIRVQIERYSDHSASANQAAQQAALRAELHLPEGPAKWKTNVRLAHQFETHLQLRRAFADARGLGEALEEVSWGHDLAIDAWTRAAASAIKLGEYELADDALRRAAWLALDTNDMEKVAEFYFWDGILNLHRRELGEADASLSAARFATEGSPRWRVLHAFPLAHLMMLDGNDRDGGLYLHWSMDRAESAGFHQTSRAGQKFILSNI